MVTYTAEIVEMRKTKTKQKKAMRMLLFLCHHTEQKQFTPKSESVASQHKKNNNEMRNILVGWCWID